MTTQRVPAERVLSGITPSGRLTLGNYLGAIRRFAQADDGYFFVADLHALTTEHDPQRLRRLTLETAALLLACGLDPLRCPVFLQSHVRAHVELGYLLESTAYVGELGRMIQFKEKGGRPKTRASLFTYPCLMAADIVLYDAVSVPVGGDQDQHVELCRDLAMRFNALYGDTFVVPELARSEQAARIADLADPEKKMSKSAPDDAPGVIRMADGPDVVRRRIARAVTDSDNRVTYEPASKPGVSNLLEILAAIEEVAPDAVADRFTSYGSLKQAVTDAVVAELEPIQRRSDALLADEPELLRLLERGAERARAQADVVLARARTAFGLIG